MDYPNLDCQTLFSVLRRFPFVGRLVLRRFTQCYTRCEDFVLRPEKALSVTCTHHISSSVKLSSTYRGGQTCFFAFRDGKRSGPFDSIGSDCMYVNIKGSRIDSYGIHLESRDDVNFWLDVNERFKTFFVSALFSDEWEAWTQLAGSACAGIRYSTYLNSRTYFSCGIQSSRKEVSAALSVFHKLHESVFGFFNVVVSATAMQPFFVCQKSFSWISLRYIQDLHSCACEVFFERRGVLLGFRVQKCSSGIRRMFAFEW